MRGFGQFAVVLACGAPIPGQRIKLICMKAAQPTLPEPLFARPLAEQGGGYLRPDGNPQAVDGCRAQASQVVEHDLLWLSWQPKRFA
ncbi:hypothetical protein D3C76_608480 [compost metagenome]